MLTPGAHGVVGLSATLITYGDGIQATLIPYSGDLSCVADAGIAQILTAGSFE